MLTKQQPVVQSHRHTTSTVTPSYNQLGSHIITYNDSVRDLVSEL